jgi:hypothetical protein
MTAFTDLLANPHAARRYLAILQPWDPAASGGAGAVAALYYSDHGFTTEPTDAPANQHFAARIARDFSFRITRELFGAGRIGGRSLPNAGEIVLVNADGGLDALLGYRWDGRDVTVLLGGDGFAYDQFGTVFTGTAQGIKADDAVVRIVIRDLAYVLDRPVQTTLYAGSGGSEGGADLKGKPKPDSFGRVRNVVPTYLGLIGGKDSYQVSRNQIEDVDTGYSNGAALTKVAGAPGPGQYSVDAATGIVTLGGSALGSVITFDIMGDKRGGTYRTSAADLVREIVVQRGGLADPDDLDTASLAALNTANSAPVGLWVDAQRTIADLADNLLGAIGAWWGFTRTGLFQAGRIAAPAATAAASYAESEIIECERLDAELPLWRIAVAYARCWRVQTGTELAGSVTAAHQAFVSAEYRDETAADATVQMAHPLARDERRETLLAGQADAAAEASRLLVLFAADREVYRVRLKTQPFLRELGETVQIAYPKYGLAAGKRFVILGMVEDAAVNEVTLTVWG